MNIKNDGPAFGNNLASPENKSNKYIIYLPYNKQFKIFLKQNLVRLSQYFIGNKIICYLIYRIIQFLNLQGV